MQLDTIWDGDGMKLNIKPIIRIIIAFFIFTILNVFVWFYLTPQYDLTDIYEIKGICTDVDSERTQLSKFTSMRLYYITMDNGNTYGISEQFIEEYIDCKFSDLVGKSICFSVPVKYFDWFNTTPDIVAWGNSEEAKIETLSASNKSSLYSNIGVCAVLLLILGVYVYIQILFLIENKKLIKARKLKAEKRRLRKELRHKTGDGSLSGDN